MQRWVVGNATVTAIVETEGAGIPPNLFFPEGSTDAVAAQDWLIPDYASPDGALRFRIQAFVIDDDHGRRVLVDPCVGNDKVRSFSVWHMQQYTFLDDLVASGFDPESVDLVVHTHLHADHVGWDTRLVDGEWIPTFPNARHLYTQAELDYRRSQDGPNEDVFADSIAPIFAAGLANIVAEDEDLGDGLRLAPTPGHTPGHVSLWIESAGERAVISGDLLHHPVQCAHPEWAETADDDAELARVTRRSFLNDVALDHVLMFGTHFPARPAGHVVPYEETWRFAPLDDA